MTEQPAWKHQTRSRLFEVLDGAAMLVADVAVVRTVVVVLLMFVVAFVMRHRSRWALVLVVSACIFLLCEMLNTIVEMLVDRISLAPNMLSARIKHSSAFVSALSGSVAFVALGVVMWQGFFHKSTTPAEVEAAAAPVSTTALIPPPQPKTRLMNPLVWTHRQQTKRKHTRWRKAMETILRGAT
jgi:diacylglycerol kinase